MAGIVPTMDHEHPGAVKISDGKRDLYHSPLSSLCIDQGCRVYSWDDFERDGFWIQHGVNQEAVRFFPCRLLIWTPSTPWIATRPDILEWVIECHRYEVPA